MATVLASSAAAEEAKVFTLAPSSEPPKNEWLSSSPASLRRSAHVFLEPEGIGAEYRKLGQTVRERTEWTGVLGIADLEFKARLIVK